MNLLLKYIQFKSFTIIIVIKLIINVEKMEKRMEKRMEKNDGKKW